MSSKNLTDCLNFRGIIVIAALLLCTGCTGSQQARFEPVVTVTGAVNWEGKPLKSGTIHFTSMEDIARGSEAYGDIQDGKYSARVTIGQKQVRITSPVSIAPSDKPFKDLIPEKYNENSNLIADVQSPVNDLNFDLSK